MDDEIINSCNDSVASVGFVPVIFPNDFTQYKNLCFIDASIFSFPDYLNSETYPVVYNSNTDRDSLKAFLLAQFTHIDRIAFVFHGPPNHSVPFISAWFINNEPYFSLDNQVFLQNLFFSLNVKSVDFLPCNLLQQQEWKDYFTVFTDVVVGASSDDTGNLRYGGDWVMENTMENIQNLYFSAEIENYTGLLVLTGLAVTFPTYVSPTNLDVVYITAFPSDAVSWGYSTDNSGSWTYQATTFSSFFTLSAAIYATGTIHVNSKDASGNVSTTLKNTSALTITITAPLVAVGYTATQLKSAGYTAAQLTTAGYTAAQLYVAGYTAAQVRQTGYNVAQLETAGYTPAVLNTAGYVTPDMTVIATIGDASNLVYSFCISGNLMYVGVGNKIKVINLSTNTVINANFYTGTVAIQYLVVEGSFIYYNSSGTTVGKLNVTSGSTVGNNANHITSIPNVSGMASDGTYLYLTRSSAGNPSVYKIKISTGGTPHVSATADVNSGNMSIYTLKPPQGNPLIVGSSLYVYVYSQNLCIEVFNKNTGISLNRNFTNSIIPQMITGMAYYNSSIYLAKNAVGIHAGVIQIGLDGKMLNPTYFMNQTSVTPTFTNMYAIAVYDNKLYCSTYNSYTIVSIPLIAPYVADKPIPLSITYPAVLGSLVSTGGTVKITNSTTEVAGIFSLDPTCTNIIKNAGTYTDVSAVFIPTDTINYYNSIYTTFQSVTVLKATPYISARPVSASVLFPNKLSSLDIIGGACLITVGGAALSGTFSIHPDLSNSVFVAGTYQDVSAIFTPTSSLNYNSVVTTIQTVTITKATIVELQSLGIPAADLKTVGYTATELLTANFTTAQLKAASFTPIEMKAAGISTATLYSIFTTPTETKSVTKAVVSDLLVSAPKATVPLSTMIGYSFESFVTSVVAVKVSDISVPIIVDISELARGKTAVYAVIDLSGSYIVLPTYSSSIRVMNIGAEKYRIYSENGTTILRDNLLTGDTVDLDGLTVIIGSVTATMTPPPNVNFALSALNSSIQLSSSSVIPSYDLSFNADATITLNTRVPASVLQNTFFFRTDSPITTDASFVYYYVDTTMWPNKNTTLSARNGVVTRNAYVTSDTGAKDFLRDLARQLFGTYLGADLFTNEDAVVADINSKFDTVADNIISLLLAIDKTDGIFSGITADLSGNKYLKDDTSIRNISRELLNELITAAPNRFIDIKTNYKYNEGTEDGFYKIPIMADDTITFKLTVIPAPNQTTSVPTVGDTLLNNRTYTVVLRVS